MNPTLAAITALVLAPLFAPSALADEAAIRKNIAERIPSFPKIDEITRTDVPGLYEVRVNETELFYSDEQGNYVIQGGQLIHTKSGTNVTTQRIAELTAIDFKSLPLKDAMVWKQGTGERKLVVFADPNCGYCKKFEHDLQSVKDITVYIFLYPVLGGDSQANAEKIWCAKDNSKVWRDWMLKRESIPENSRCDTSALARNFVFGQKHRIRGTPGLVFEDGRQQAGAINSEQLERQLSATSRTRG